MTGCLEAWNLEYEGSGLSLWDKQMGQAAELGSWLLFLCMLKSRFLKISLKMSHCMGKPTICKTKMQISFTVTAKPISAFVFATRKV